jgi:hypothetical protein
MKQKKLQPKMEMPTLDSRFVNARRRCFILALTVISPYLTFLGLLGMGGGLPAIYLPIVCGWLFLVTWVIIRLDDYLLLGVYQKYPHGRLVNLSTVSVWVGFIIMPVVGLLLLPERPVYMMATVYLVMGLANLLFKLDRRKGLGNWLAACNVSPEEARTIYDPRVVMWETGVYILAVRPWWVLRITPKGRGCMVQLVESEGQHLSQLSPGKRRQKYLASMFYVVDWIEKQLYRLGQEVT